MPGKQVVVEARGEKACKKGEYASMADYGVGILTLGALAAGAGALSLAVTCIPANDYEVQNAKLTIKESRETSYKEPGIHQDRARQSVYQIHQGYGKTEVRGLFARQLVDVAGGPTKGTINYNDDGRFEALEVRDETGKVIAEFAEQENSRLFSAFKHAEVLSGKVDGKLVFGIEERDPGLGPKEVEINYLVEIKNVDGKEVVTTVQQNTCEELRTAFGFGGEGLRAGTKIYGPDGKLILHSKEHGLLDIFPMESTVTTAKGQYTIENKYELFPPREIFDGWDIKDASGKVIAAVRFDDRCFTREIGYEFYAVDEKGVLQKVATIAYNKTIIQEMDPEWRKNGKSLHHMFVMTKLDLNKAVDIVDKILKLMPDQVNSHKELHNIEHGIDLYRLRMSTSRDTLASAATEEDTLTIQEALDYFNL
jgi:hypothetical protein